MSWTSNSFDFDPAGVASHDDAIPVAEVAPSVVVVDIAEDTPTTQPVSAITRRIGQRGKIAATIVSVLVHVWILGSLAEMGFTQSDNYHELPFENYVVESEPEPEPQVVEPTPTEFTLAEPSEQESQVTQALSATSVGVVYSTAPQMKADPRLIVKEPDVPLASTAVYDIPAGVEIDSQLVVNGTTGDSLVHIESAMDLVTWEIAKNLQEQKVLVVWLVDASGSLLDQRAIVANRLQRVYGELNALQNANQVPKHELPVLSGVVTFGNKTNFITQAPTENFQEILDALRSAPTDPSGVENTFNAVADVLSRWGSYRTAQQRRIMLITLTDEAGDDFSNSLEKAIVQCQKYGAKAYVVGPSAVFGRRDGFIPYVAKEDGKTYKLPVAIGPEVPVFEALDLPFWFGGSQYEYLSSGFAPYALARLVHETGGVYFMTNMTTMSGLTPLGVFEPDVMRPFQPDYNFGSLDAYEKDLKKHPLRLALVDAAARSRRFTAKGTPTLDLRVTAGNFKQAASDAQKSVAESQLMVEMILQAIPDSLEKQLDREPSARWRMNFCLTYGRLLAHRVRCMEYNAAFAWLKNDLTADDINKKSNHWIVRSDKSINYAGNLRKTAQKAEELLQRVVKEAPGTPWAVLAARELKDPFGIRIEQRFIPPPPPAPPRPPGPPPKQVLFAPEETKRPAPQPKPAPPPKPVLPNL